MDGKQGIKTREKVDGRLKYDMGAINMKKHSNVLIDHLLTFYS